MTGTRLMLPILAALVVLTPADAGSIFGRKPKTEAQVKRLIDGLRTETDEKKRRAALAELRETDPRSHPDVIPALTAALQRDTSPQVRADAAEAIGQFKIVFGLAGLALETAAESDPSRSVRDSAQQALWEYHLTGYRSTRGAGGIAGQTVEPPVAKPAVPRRPVEVVAAAGSAPVLSPIAPVAPPPLGPATVVVPPVGPALPPPAHTVLVSRPLPEPTELAPPSGLRILLTVAPPPLLNVTSEPPVAPPPDLPIAPAPTPVAASSADVPENPSHSTEVGVGVSAAAEPPSELIDLPLVSLPPTAVLPVDRPTAVLPVDRPADLVPVTPPVTPNEYGPRVDYPAALMLTGVRRFKTPE
ncbi:MAG: repeat protein [Gemmataceae bacterium]|nr:repeat protein [Gemmataceae bacterium]